MVVNYLKSFNIKRNIRLVVLTALLFLVLIEAGAQTTYYSRANGNWSTNSTWSTVGFGSATNTGTFPGSGDIVFIGGGRTVTVTANAAASSVTFNAGTSISNNLVINSGVTLTVSGTVTIPQAVTSGSNNLNVGAGNLVTGNLDFTASPGGAGHEVIITTGTLTVNGNIAGIGTGSEITFNDAGLLRVGGTLFTSAQGTINGATGYTVEYFANAAQTVQTHNYENLSITGNGTKTLSGTGSIGTNLTIGAGATLVIPGVDVVVGGATTINGTLSFTSTTGNKTFVGLVTVNGTWSNTASEFVTFNGGLTNNGTFNAGAGNYSFTVNSQVLTGSLTIRTVIVTGTAVELTNTNTLTVTSALAGTGKFIQATGATLNMVGNCSISGMTATALNNTVNYSSNSSQTIFGVNYYNLGLSGAGTKTLLETTTQVNGNLTLGGTVSVPTSVGLAVGGSLTIGAGATFSGGSYVHSVGGSWSNLGTFTPGGSTIHFTGGNQSIGGNAINFQNVRFSGSGTKTLQVSATLAGTLFIDPTAIVALSGITSHQANAIVLNGVLQSASGTWGATGSGAANINDTYFSGSGRINIISGGNTYYSRADGDWNNVNTWSNTGFGGITAGTVPSASDFVIIGGGHHVTVTSATGCQDLEFDAGTSVTNRLTINSGITFTVTGMITIPQTVTSGSNILEVDAGNLNGGNLEFTSTVNGAGHSLTLSTGVASFSGNVTGTSPASNIVISSNGQLRVGGSLFSTTQGTLSLATGSTVEYSGSLAQSIQQHNYQNLLLSGASNKTLVGSLVISGNLTVSSGSTLVVPGADLTVNGMTTVDGTISYTSGTGTKTFVGLLTINGTWSNPVNEGFVFRGGITNNGTFTAGTGPYTFNTNAQTLTGNFSLSTLVITGVQLINTNTLSVSSSIQGTGTLVQGAGSILNLGGASTITGLNASASNNTVNYAATAAQTVKGINYFNLGLSGSGVKTLQVGTTTIAGSLTLDGTTTASAVGSLTIGAGLNVNSGATFNASSFTHNIGGDINIQGGFTTSGGTIQMNGADQSIINAGGTINNLTLAGSGTKHFNVSVLINGALAINSGVVLSLEGVATHQANTLSLNGVVQSATGTWGGLGSGAQNVNTTYFSATGGLINILTGGNTFYSRVSGDWNDPATWSTSGFNGPQASSVPTVDDYVIIGAGRSISLTSAGTCSVLSFDAGTSVTNSLVVGAGGVLQAENITIPQTVTAGSNNLTITSGIVQAVNLSFTSSASGAGHKLSIGTGAAEFTGNITGIGPSSVVEFTGAGSLSVGGAFFTSTNGTLTTVAGCTVEYSGAAAQFVEAHNYRNLVMSGTGTKTMNGTTVSVNGNLTVETGSTLIVPGVILTVTGTTLVDGAISFATSTTGNKTLIGLVTVNGSWSNPINESFEMRGGITNTGTFNAGTGTYAFTVNSQVLTGTLSIPRVTVTGSLVVLTNSNSLTVSTLLTGTGRLTQASGAVLNLGGTTTITNLTATAANNIVNYTSMGNQTLKGVPYFHLYLSGGGIKTFQAGTTTITGDLVLTGTVSTASVPAVTIGGNLDIGAGTTFNAPTSFQVAGNFVDAGTFVNNSGTVVFNGTTNQSISGNALTDFYNITVPDAASAKVLTALTSKNLQNVLTLGANVTFDADGDGSAEFSLKSLSGGETRDGTIGPLPASASVQGAVRIERRMNPEINVWRYIAAPVQGVNITHLTDDMQAIRNSVRWYKETLINTSNRWTALTSNSEVLLPGRGYQVWMYQNVELNWDVKGTINQGPFTWSTANGGLTSSTGTTFTTEDKWNLIGNPYPSSIRWDGNPSNWTITTDEVATTIYVSDESGLGTLAYNYVDGSGADGSGSVFPVLQDGVIATGQSFWVYVLPGASITIQESAKVPSNQNAGYEFYRKPAGAPVALNQLTIRMGQNGVRDEAYFKLNELATRELDLKWDAPKFFNERMNIYFVDDANQAMGMHTLPNINDDREIRLGYKVSAPGTYSFTAAFKGNMEELQDWYFLDRETQEKIRLADLDEVEVTIAEGKLADTNRFALVKSQSAEAALKLYPNPATNVLNVFAPSAINGIEIVDLQGNRVIAQRGLSDEFSASIDVLDLKPGLYILKVHTQWGALSEKFVKK